jgi:hypothetical protein
MLAAILGGTLALWLAQGDTDASDTLALSCTVTQHDTYDFHGTQFFALTCADGAAVLSIDGDLPLASWLRNHDKQKLAIDLTPRTVQRLER